MSYFGILSKKKLECELTQNLSDLVELDDYEIENKIKFKSRESEIKYLLIEKDIFEVSYISDELNFSIDYTKEDFQNITFEDFEGEINIPIILSLKTYNIIWEIFKYRVKDKKTNFFNHFMKITYGLNYEERKKIALSEFNKIFESFEFENFEEPFEIRTSENIKTFMPTPLFQLFKKRQSIINSLDYHVYLPYLFGEIDLYKLKKYQNSDEFNELLTFQSDLEILLELNDKFNFETDVYFNNFYYFKLYSITQLHCIKEIEPLAFCLCKLFEYDEIKATDVESMYSFLLNNFFIGKKTDFLNIVNSNFKTNFKKIRDYETNLNHDYRVKKIHQDWKKFKEKFC
jgi:hypothetical protein